MHRINGFPEAVILFFGNVDATASPKKFRNNKTSSKQVRPPLSAELTAPHLEILALVKFDRQNVGVMRRLANVLCACVKRGGLFGPDFMRLMMPFIRCLKKGGFMIRVFDAPYVLVRACFEKKYVS